MKKIIIVNFVLIIFFILFFISCGDNGNIRKSVEEVETVETKKEPAKKKSSHGNMQAMQKKHAYEWDIPEGWETGKSTSRIRLATLNLKDSKEEALCTIIPLLGDGGGFEPNVKLWLEQIGIKMEFADKNFKEFIQKSEKFKTKNGLDVIKIDAADLVKNNSDESVMVSIIKLETSTIFIKLKGKKSVLVKNREKFKTLTESFRIKK